MKIYIIQVCGGDYDGNYEYIDSVYTDATKDQIQIRLNILYQANERRRLRNRESFEILEFEEGIPVSQ